MFLSEVTALVERVRGAAGDNQAAHGYEDDLYHAVLEAIATGQCQDAPPEDFAAEALKAREIEFTRWYA